MNVDQDKANCPFFARHMYVTDKTVNGQFPFLLIDQQGNRCGLITWAHSPCVMLANDGTPDWKLCPVVREVRLK